MTTPIHEALQSQRPAPHGSSRRYGLFRCRIAGDQPGNLWRKPGGAHPGGYRLAGPPGGRWVLSGKLCRGLEAAASELPHWKNQPSLAAGERLRGECYHPHPLFQKRWWYLSPALPMHPLSSHPRRTFTVRPQPQQLALQAARAREKTEAFKQQYAHRSGIEGTISLGVRTFDLRRLATWVWRKPISNIFWSLVRSISRAWRGGSRVSPCSTTFHCLCSPCFNRFRLSQWVRQQDQSVVDNSIMTWRGKIQGPKIAPPGPNPVIEQRLTDSHRGDYCPGRNLPKAAPNLASAPENGVKEKKPLRNPAVLRRKSEQDCRFCQEDRGKGGPKKTVRIAGYFCLNKSCEYYGVRDEQTHALVEYGSHGVYEKIRDLKRQACKKKVTERRKSILYRLKCHLMMVGNILWLFR